MKPVVILDANALFGRRPFERADGKLLLQLSKSRYVRLVVPEVVLLELSRQWEEDVRTRASEASAAIYKLNAALIDVEVPVVAVDLPEHDRSTFYDFARKLLTSIGAELPSAPDTSTAALLAKDINVRKPFDRDGKGFRDALIWETICELCRGLQDPATCVIFVTNDRTGFCDEKSALHPDLRQDLATSQRLDVVQSLRELWEHDEIAPLAGLLRVADAFTPERLQDLVDYAIADLQGAEVAKVLATYIGEGMYDMPINTVLDEATFEEILPDIDSIASDVYRAGDKFTIRVTVEAQCTLAGFVDKSTYFINDDQGLALLEDWNRYVYRVSESRNLRFTFSAEFEDAQDEVVLAVDEAEEI